MTHSFPPAINTILDDFALLNDWDERYGYIIELGNHLPPLAKTDYTTANKVAGCASQVWLVRKQQNGTMILAGDSDAHIVRGLIAILLKLYSGRKPSDISEQDAHELFAQLGLDAHLTAQRANGFRAMVARIQQFATEK